MSKLKVRLWDTFEDKVIDDQSFAILPTRPTMGATILFEPKILENPDLNLVDWADADLIMSRYEIERSTFCRDKNDVEVYENDVVKLYRGDYVDEYLVMEDGTGLSAVSTDTYDKTNGIEFVIFDEMYTGRYEVIGQDRKAVAEWHPKQKKN